MESLEKIEQALARIEGGMERLLQAQTGPVPEWLAIKGAALITGLSAPHIRRAVRSGNLPAANVGTRSRPIWRIFKNDLENWMRERKGGSTFPPIAGSVPVPRKSRHFDD